MEFADFRKYEVGDDFRHVDWNIYARLDRLILRQFVEEEDVRIDILIDQSRSMHFGRPISKFDCARKAAAALAFVGVASLDRVGVSAFDSTIRAKMRAMRGRGRLLSLLSFLAGLCEGEQDEGADVRNPGPEPTGRQSRTQTGVTEKGPGTNLGSVLRGYQKMTLRPGILFVISDFLDPGDFRGEMKLLASRGFDLNLLQVLAPEEMKPEVGGDLLLVDSETGEAREITANERMVTAYLSELSQFTRSLESFCRATAIGYTLITADIAFEDVLFRSLIESRMAN